VIDPVKLHCLGAFNHAHGLESGQQSLRQLEHIYLQTIELFLAMTGFLHTAQTFLWAYDSFFETPQLLCTVRTLRQLPFILERVRGRTLESPAFVLEEI
jgi:hypothetical protein